VTIEAPFWVTLDGTYPISMAVVQRDAGGSLVALILIRIANRGDGSRHQEVAMSPLNRREVITAGLVGAASLAPATPGSVVASQTPGARTPPEECLAVETFPVRAGDHPHDVAPAAFDQRIWYTAQRAGALGLFDPETGVIDTIPLGAGSAPHGVIIGPDGAAWVTDGGLNAILKVDSETFALSKYPVPGKNANLSTAAIDPDGVVWFTGQGGIVGRVDPARHRPGDPADIIDAPRGQGPYGITVTPAGDVHFASLAGNYLGRIEIDGEGFRIIELDPPTPNQGTRRAWSDTKGVIWTSEWNAGQVGRYDPTTDTWEEWRLPGESPQAYAVYVDERDDVWLTDFSSNAIVRFDPDTESFVSIPLPDPGSAVRQLHGRPGQIWGAASGGDKLVVVRCDQT
jgi:virginiamycin B lyase